jgi:ABC-type lipoprotein release transport system permease subunit
MYLSVMAGAAISVAVLVGALLVGDCVRYSLQRFALLRLGGIGAAADLRQRYVSEDLATALAGAADRPVAGVLRLRGVVWTRGADGEAAAQVNHVNVLGVDPAFWQFSGAARPALGNDEIVLSDRLARALGVNVGDEVSLRVAQPSLLPRDAPLSSRREKLTQTGAFTVRRIAGDEEMGRFSLEANQLAPYNAFVSRGWLQERIGMAGRVNLLLAGSAGDGEQPAGDTLDDALRRAWRPEHSGVSIREAGGGVLQVESDRVFLDPATGAAALGLPATAPGGAAPVGVLAYMVNTISRAAATGEVRTAYSFVVASSPSADPRLSLVPPDMRDDEILLNQWAAHQLGAPAGDAIRLTYFEIAAADGLVERSRSFRLRGILEMESLEAERALMPEFPGLSDVNSCRDWSIGMPMDAALLADKANEDYWQQYRATPKAIVTLRAGQAMWASRFGDLTSVRCAEAGGRAALSARLAAAIDPVQLGLFFMPVRQQALKAASDAMDFGELFLSMSVFLIAAALMLTGLLFVFGVQQRAEEMGTLLAVGYRPRHLRRLFLLEGAWVAAAGSILGTALGVAYTWLLIRGLATTWSGAVASSAIRFHATAAHVAAGGVAGFGCALLTLLAYVWRQGRHPARELLAADFTGESQARAHGRGRTPWISIALAAAGGIGALALVAATVVADIENTVPVFFGAGSLLLLAALGLVRLLLRRMDTASGERVTLAALGARNASRRRGRSLTAVGLLACGSFMVFAVAAMQENIGRTAALRSSGTGGFALFGESTIPVPDPLDSTAACKTFRLDAEDALKGVSAVGLRMLDGDDASCLNLNRAQSPRLLGVDPAAFASLGAFAPAGEAEALWGLFNTPLPDGVVPGLAGDANTAQWGLMKKVGPGDGDEIPYRDERGNTFRVRLVGRLPMRLSVFQGSILIPTGSFTSLYPSDEGCRMFLFDVPRGRNPEAARQALARRMSGVGLDVAPAVERLAAFYSVEQAYLRMFLVLGGLGLLLGSVGMGLVVLRNVLERRSELAVLRCVGFSRRRVLGLVLAEHAFLLGAGMASGGGAALLAIWPNLRAPGVAVPFVGMALLFLAVLAAGAVCIVAAARTGLRGSLMNALRNE